MKRSTPKAAELFTQGFLGKGSVLSRGEGDA